MSNTINNQTAPLPPHVTVGEVTPLRQPPLADRPLLREVSKVDAVGDGGSATSSVAVTMLVSGLLSSLVGLAAWTGSLFFNGIICARANSAGIKRLLNLQVNGVAGYTFIVMVSLACLLYILALFAQLIHQSEHRTNQPQRKSQMVIVGAVAALAFTVAMFVLILNNDDAHGWSVCNF